MDHPDKKEKPHLYNGFIVILGFLLIIFGGFISFAYTNFNLFQDVSHHLNAESLVALREKLNGTLVFKNELNRVYNTLQNDFLKNNEIDDFTYFRNSDGGFIVIRKALEEEGIDEAADNLTSIYQGAQEIGADFLYISMPSRLSADYEKLLEGIDFSNEYKDEFLHRLDADIPVLDLRESARTGPAAMNYYKTDHHWNIDAAFSAFRSTVSTCSALFGLDLDPDNIFVDPDQYQTIIKENCFSGSTRQNIGPDYLDKEDLKILIPRNAARFDFQYIVKGEVKLHKTGKFEEALLNMQLLEDDGYLNKYNVFLSGGSVESIIKNADSRNSLKLLIISSSYGRSFVPYISQCFAETRYLDPQTGRFNDNVIEYMDAYKPDVVLVLHDYYVNAETVLSP